MKQKDTEKQNGLLPLYSDIVFKIFCIKKPHLLARLLDAVLGFKGSDRIESLQILNPEIALTKDLEIHIIELPKFLKQVEKLDTELENWLYFLGKAEHLQENEMKELQERNPVMEEAIEALKDISLDEKTRAYYEMRLKSERDFMAMRHYAYHEGLKKGVEQGIQEGKEEERLLAEKVIEKERKRAEHKSKLRTAINLKKMNLSIQAISIATELPETYLEKFFLLRSRYSAER